MTYGNILKRLFFQPQKKFQVGQRRANGMMQGQQTWWRDNSINDVITEKRRLWKVWKNGGSKEDYAKAKKVAKHAVFTAKRKILDENFSTKDDVALFCVAKHISKQNQDIVGEKCVKDDDNKLAYSDTAKKNAWKQHYQCLLNVEFP